MTAAQAYKLVNVMLGEMPPNEQDSFMQLIIAKKTESNQLCVGNTKMNTKVKKQRGIHEHLQKLAEKESKKRFNKTQ